MTKSKFCSNIKNKFTKNKCTMKKKTLMGTVIVTGNSFTSNAFASITFTPTKEPGWYLQTKEGLVPINSRIAYCKKGRIVISAFGTTINVWEHIGALRFMGISNVIVSIPKETKSKPYWPPYLGGAGAYYRELRSSIIETDEEIQFIKPSINCHWSYPSRRNGFTAVNQDDCFSIKAKSGWTPLQTTEKTIKLLDENFQTLLTNEIFTARPQGYPHWAYYVAYCAEIFGWGNFHYISWLKDAKSFGQLQQLQQEWENHRLQDVLGAASLAHHDFLPYCRIHTEFGGHQSDVAAIKTAFLNSEK